MEKILDRMTRWIRPFAVPNLTILIIAGQALVYILSQTGHAGMLELAALDSSQVLKGELWRLFSFLLIPPASSPIWNFFAWWVFYFTATMLEGHWGTARYNLYLLLGTIITVATSFLLPHLPFTGAFLQGTVFLAFATLFPDVVFQLFFVLPVKAKWLAWLAGLGYAFAFAQGPNMVRLMVLAAVGNYLIFFAPSLYQRIRYGVRKKRFEVKARIDTSKPRHVCSVCGITNLTHPEMDFRYCTKCAGQRGYCEEHIRNHEHVSEQVEEV